MVESFSISSAWFSKQKVLHEAQGRLYVCLLGACAQYLRGALNSFPVLRLSECGYDLSAKVLG